MWVKLDDGFTEHPKVLEAGEDAAWLFVAGLAYCNRNPANNGFIPAAQVPRLTLKPNAAELAKRLVTCGEPIGKAGLWDEVPGGYRVHDYHEYQPEEGPAGEVKSAGKKAAGSAGGRTTQAKHPGVVRNLRQFRPKQPEASPEATPEANAEAGAPKHSEAHRSPVPDPERLSRARNAGARDPRAWGADDLDAAWRDAYKRPTGDAHRIVDLARLLRETAAVRRQEPAELATRWLEAFRSVLADWKARGVHGGAPRIEDAVKHFSVVLDAIDAEAGPELGEASSHPSGLPTFAEFRARAKAAAGGGGAS